MSTLCDPDGANSRDVKEIGGGRCKWTKSESWREFNMSDLRKKALGGNQPSRRAFKASNKINDSSKNFCL